MDSDEENCGEPNAQKRLNSSTKKYLFTNSRTKRKVYSPPNGHFKRDEHAFVIRNSMFKIRMLTQPNHYQPKNNAYRYKSWY